MVGFSDIRNAFKGRSSQPDDVSLPNEQAAYAKAPKKLDSLEQAMFDRKAQALADAKELATSEGRRPTMTDYFIAAHQLGEKQGLDASEWNPKIFADLSGQTISGFDINRADIEPNKHTLAYADLKARIAAGPGNAPTTLDQLNALQQIQQSGEEIPSIDEMKKIAQASGIESFEDYLDLDNDRTFNKFFASIDSQIKFANTIFDDGTCFHPAGTAMRCGRNPDGTESAIPLTQGASFKNVTFDGMGPDDNVHFAGKEFTDVSFVNIKGGTIYIPDDTKVTNMNIQAADALLEIGANSKVHKLTATGLVKIKAEDGVEISDSKFNCTLDMGCELAGSRWKNIEFAGVNFAEVDFAKASFTRINITNSDVGKLDLSGAHVVDLSIDGKLIDDKSKLNSLGIAYDEHTNISISKEAMVAEIGKTMNRAVASIGMGAPVAQATQQPAEIALTNAAAQPAPAAPSKITFGGEADFNSIDMGIVAATAPRTVEKGAQADLGSGNMNVGNSGGPSSSPGSSGGSSGSSSA